jgi:hypothetical protein
MADIDLDNSCAYLSGFPCHLLWALIASHAIE